MGGVTHFCKILHYELFHTFENYFSSNSCLLFHAITLWSNPWQVVLCLKQIKQPAFLFGKYCFIWFSLLNKLSYEKWAKRGPCHTTQWVCEQVHNNVILNYLKVWPHSIFKWILHLKILHIKRKWISNSVRSSLIKWLSSGHVTPSTLHIRLR